MHPLPRIIFLSRWLQLPLYLGLILAQCVYVWQFWVELVHLLQASFGDADALEAIRRSVAVPGAAGSTEQSRETLTMLLVLGLIDVVMISNLLIMVIIGGYETFVSRMRLEGHPDQPEWLSHVNASVLKVKLATAIIGISSIHLLRTFINAAAYDEKTLLWQTAIHITFLLSAMAIAVTDRLMPQPKAHAARHAGAAADAH
ncbi:MAG: TIGR00645 family protein [Betaproteobacteria bacterium PRO3]|nr:TIGR00645 family protein [Betaproteobacteria bacterium PRO3]